MLKNFKVTGLEDKCEFRPVSCHLYVIVDFVVPDAIKRQAQSFESRKKDYNNKCFGVYVTFDLKDLDKAHDVRPFIDNLVYIDSNGCDNYIDYKFTKEEKNIIANEITMYLFNTIAELDS